MLSDDVEKMEQAFFDVSQLFTQGFLLKGWNQSPVYSIKNFDELRPKLFEEAVKTPLLLQKNLFLPRMPK